MLRHLAARAAAAGLAGRAGPAATATASGRQSWLSAVAAPFSSSSAAADPPPPPPPGTVTPLTSDAAAAAAMAGPAPAVIDYTAAWCGPCRAMKAPFAALAASHPGVRFHTADIDDPALEQTVSAAGVSAVPTFAFYAGGKLIGTVQGADLGAVTAAVEELSEEG
jgi:thioredoxin 1